MKKEKIIQAWKDEKFREGLSAEEQALVPDNPAGFIDLTDDELEVVGGGQTGSGISHCICQVGSTGTGSGQGGGCSCSC